MPKQLTIRDCEAATITPSQNASKKLALMFFVFFNKGNTATKASHRPRQLVSNPLHHLLLLCHHGNHLPVWLQRDRVILLQSHIGTIQLTSINNNEKLSKVAHPPTRVADDTLALRVFLLGSVNWWWCNIGRRSSLPPVNYRQCIGGEYFKVK